MSTGSTSDRDHLGARRLSRRETIMWYAVAFASYVAVSVFHKGLLNWLVGPLWLITVVWFGPLVWDLSRGRRP